MAIIKCVECGKEISDRVDNCIHCGCPNYKKQYNENPLRTKVDIVKALMLLVEVKRIDGYKEPDSSDKTSTQYYVRWISLNCESLAKDIDLETVSLLSDNPQKDYEALHGVIAHEIEMKNIFRKQRDKVTQGSTKNTRILKRCKKCGMLNRWSDRKGECLWCHNKTYEEYEFPDYTEDEKKEISMISKKLFYILNFSFNAIRPQEDDYFGCIEMCDYLKEEYSLGDEVYELAGIINTDISSLEHSKFVPEYGQASGRMNGITLDDGRFFDYELVYYSSEITQEYSEYKKLSEEDNKKLEENTRGELKKIIDSIIKLKPSSKGREITDLYSPDFDFGLEVVKKGRAHVVNNVKTERARKETIKTRNKIVEQITQPVANTDPNYIESAECPNCHKKSVYRISNVKRGASIGLFGLFSKNVGKTMECRSCGYKW